MRSFVDFFVGDLNKKELRKLDRIVAKINSFAPTLEALSDRELQDRLPALRDRFRALRADQQTEIDQIQVTSQDELEGRKRIQQVEQAILETLLEETFALVREAAWRVLGLRPYDVQLVGGIVLHQGKIAEMRTGEGKTLVATLPVVLNSLTGRGVHLVTVNDYLAVRDAAWMGRLYDFLGLSVGVIGNQTSWKYTSESKPKAKSQKPKVQEAVVGELSAVDSPPSHPDWPELVAVTRKEAYVCDITYGTNNEFGFDYLRDNMAQIPAQVVGREPVYAIIDEVDSILIDEARTPLIISAPAAASTNLYATFAQIAKRLKKETDYTVDEKFRAVTLTDTGIGHVEGWLGIDNLYAPDHVQLVHHLDQALKAATLFQRDKEYVAREGQIIIVDEFTGRLMPGRRYSEGLHQAIEAKEGVEVQRESDTYATISFQNLFRLYPKLAGMTGTAVTEREEFWKMYAMDVVEIPTHRDIARVDHQDMIFKTEAAKLTAAIEEIQRRHEAGQPLLIGTSSIEKNERLSLLLNKAGVPHEILNAKNHEREAKIIANAGTVGAVTLATNMAGRGVDIILGGAPPSQDEVKSQKSKSKSEGAEDLKVDFTVWETEHQKVLELGGLAVIGTERHEARRIDNQLRGRAGRQGDPGESLFYVSMEDDLMRIFGGERMKAIMDRLGVPDDQPIQARLISRSIESAQRRVEGHNFDMRKHLVEYDDVMNKHREYIYRLRRKILFGEQQTVNGEQSGPLSENDSRFTLHSSLFDQAIALMTDDERATFEKKCQEWGAELTDRVIRTIWLRTIDLFWVEHLNTMEALRTGIGLRGYGQHNPLVAYQQEAFQLFGRLKEGINQEVIRLLLTIQVSSQAPPAVAAPAMSQQLVYQGAKKTGDRGAGVSAAMDAESSRQAESGGSPTEASAKVGRNDLCPCGSGKKYKKCHGK